MTSVTASYQGGLGMAEPTHTQIATTITSSSKSNTYGWLGQFPAFREWVGPRTVKDMEAHVYAITNKHYESTIGINRDDMEDDNLGIYAPMFAEMGRATASFPDELVYKVLADGFATACYDGQFFFDTDHPVNADHDGQGDDASVSNTIAGAESPWFLMDTSRPIKPIIHQVRKAPQITAMTKADDEKVFDANEYRYGVDLRCNVGYGFWQMAIGSKSLLDDANLTTAYEMMRGFKADGGKALGMKPKTLVVGTGNETKAWDLIDKALVAGGDSNRWYKKLNVVVSDELA
jgi:phage major head subunit gpT-like protein